MEEEVQGEKGWKVDISRITFSTPPQEGQVRPAPREDGTKEGGRVQEEMLGD